MPSWAPREKFHVIPLFQLLITSLLFSFSNTFDTITPTHFISDSKNQALWSSNGNFKLGFFSPGNSQNRYVGIWFNKLPTETVVWVANRGAPLKNSTGIFKIADDGNLAVFYENGKTPIWSSDASVPDYNSTARLLPSGNLALVIRNKSRNSEFVVWQSFDYPTNTILPGMKIGLDKRTGRKPILTCWKSSDDPAPGEFSAGLDPQGSPQFFLYKNSIPYWRGGPWNGITLSGVPDVRNRLKTYEMDYGGEVDIFNYNFDINQNEISFSFEARNGTIPSILVLEPQGILERLIWWESRNSNDKSKTWARFWVAPEDLCDQYARCGDSAICNTNNAMQCTCLPGFKQLYPQDWYINCVEKRKEGCGKGSGEGFLKLANIKVPDARSSSVYVNMSLKECKRECLQKCNCTGFASLNVTGNGCRIWYGKLTDIRTYVDGQDFYIRVDAIELNANTKKISKHLQSRTLVLSTVPVFLGVLGLTLCISYLWRKHAKMKGHRKKRKQQEQLFLDTAYRLSNHRDSANKELPEKGRNVEVTFFELSTVITATDNFSSANKLGQGGFGPVYKGQLPDGQEIAVKRLSKISGQGAVEFKNEVLLIAKLQHRNLVRLLGCCIEEEENVLIYEFMPNKSLNYFIFDESRKLLLDWKRRFDIIVGIARGILYLHQDSRLRIIHRDLKASNILLDAETNPKISDFGTARIFGGDETQANTNRVVGTFGYMSPEYALDGLFSTKSDVFSFGVIVLEVISGKKNVGFFGDDLSSNLIGYAWELWRDDRPLDIVDSFMVASCPAPQVLRCIQVGLLCVQASAADRPTISSVVFMLSNETTLPCPKEPAFTVRRIQKDAEESPNTGTKKCSAAINDMTITKLDGR